MTFYYFLIIVLQIKPKRNKSDFIKTLNVHSKLKSTKLLRYLFLILTLLGKIIRRLYIIYF